MALLPGWETKRVFLARNARFGFGIAISGGIDTRDGSFEIYVSDVLKDGPAEGVLQVNDRIISVNGVALGNVSHEIAIQHLRNAGQVANLVIQRPSKELKKSKASLPNPQVPHRKRETKRPSSRQEHYDFLTHNGVPEPYSEAQSFYPDASIYSMTDQQISGRRYPESPYANMPTTTPLELTFHSTTRPSPRVMKKNMADSHYEHHRSRLPHDLPVSPISKSSSETYSEIVIERDKPSEDLGFDLSSQLIIGYVHPQSEAYRLGLRTGHIVTNINGVDTSLISVLDARNLLQRRDDIRLKTKHPKSNASSVHKRMSQNAHRSREIPKEARIKMESVLLNQDVPDAAMPPRPLSMKSVHRSLEEIPLKYTRAVSPPKKEEVITKSQSPSIPLVLSTPQQAIQVESLPLPPAIDLKPGIKNVIFDKSPQLGAGVRLTGGNRVGIFIAAVQPNSPAHQQGIKEGDQLLKVNGNSMEGKTKEEAVLELVSLESHVELELDASTHALYRSFLASRASGDNFYVRANFSYNKPGELLIRPGYVFLVVDTLVGGMVGNWQAVLIHPLNSTGVTQSGIIPNSSRAEQLSLMSNSLPDVLHVENVMEWAADGHNHTWKRGNETNYPHDKERFMQLGGSLGRKKKRTKKLLLPPASSTGIPAYERVVQRVPSFYRPVVLFGPLTNEARRRLLLQFPDEFATPETAFNSLSDIGDLAETLQSVSASGENSLLTISNIRRVVESGRHCLLDVVPRAANRLATSSLAPIIILMQPLDKTVFKGLLKNWAPSGGSYSKLARQEIWKELQDLQDNWAHLFTDVITLTSTEETSLQPQWFFRLVESIRRQQRDLVWFPESWRDHHELAIIPPEPTTAASAAAIGTLQGPSNHAACHVEVVCNHRHHVPPPQPPTLVATAEVKEELVEQQQVTTEQQSASIDQLDKSDALEGNANLVWNAPPTEFPPSPPRIRGRVETDFGSDQSDNLLPLAAASSSTPPYLSTLPIAKLRSKSPSSNSPDLKTHLQHNILAEAVGYFTETGGILDVPGTGVRLTIPPYALSPSTNRAGFEQRIFIKIYRDCPADTLSAFVSMSSSAQAALVSPLVMCGPQGLYFRRPVSLRLPNKTFQDVDDNESELPERSVYTLLHAHADNTHSWQDGGSPSEVERDFIIVKLDHF